MKSIFKTLRGTDKLTSNTKAILLSFGCILSVVMVTELRQILNVDDTTISIEQETSLTKNVPTNSQTKTLLLIAIKNESTPIENQGTDELPQIDLMTPKNWIETNGYHILDQFVEVEDQSVKAIHSDYLSYDLETLLALAEQGDGLGQLYYAMNIRNEDLEQAIYWYEQAAINTGYTAVIQKTALAYYQTAEKIAFELKSINDQQSESFANLQMDYQESFIKAKTWLSYGIQRGDPLIVNLSNALSPNTNYLSDEDLNNIDIATKANALGKAISEKRKQAGLPELPTIVAPNLSKIEDWLSMQEEPDYNLYP